MIEFLQLIESDEVFTHIIIVLTPRGDCHFIEKPCRTWGIASEDKINFPDERDALKLL